MRNDLIKILVLSIVVVLVSRCGTENQNVSSSNKQEATAQYKALSPYEVKADEPLDPKNLRDEVKRWNEAWIGKEITVIAWCGAGTTPGKNKMFSNKEKPGLIRLKCAFNEDVDPTFFERVDLSTQYTLIKGKIAGYTNSLELVDCVQVGPYGDTSFIQVDNISPATWKTETPVFSENIVNAMNAWVGVEVAVKGEASMANKGNVIRFTSEDRKETYVSCRFKSMFSGDGKTAERIVQGRINRLSGDGSLDIVESSLK